MQTQTSTEPKLGYADALLAAKQWLVESERGSLEVPSDRGFIQWYAYNARRYTIESAWGYYWWGVSASAALVLRPEEGEVPSPSVRREGLLHSPDEQGRETVPTPPSHSIPKGVILYV